jgi:hypothetical protein
VSEAVVGAIDHAVVLVYDLDAAADSWSDLGFVISPRGTHSPHMGTANHTIMFEQDYIELTGILVETDLNQASRMTLDEVGEGIDRIAMRTQDLGATADWLSSAGVPISERRDFTRPVRCPDGRTLEAAFRTFEWDASLAPSGLRLSACEHRTPDAVWRPELLRHPNGARRLAEVDVLASDPQEAASRSARLFGTGADEIARGSWRVGFGPGRAGLVFRDLESLVRHRPDLPVEEMRREGVVALVVAVENLTAARRFARHAVERQGSLTVPPINGVGLVFQADPSH